MVLVRTMALKQLLDTKFQVFRMALRFLRARKHSLALVFMI